MINAFVRLVAKDARGIILHVMT
jgi:hypothetical protein